VKGVFSFSLFVFESQLSSSFDLIFRCLRLMSFLRRLVFSSLVFLGYFGPISF